MPAASPAAFLVALTLVAALPAGPVLAANPGPSPSAASSPPAAGPNPDAAHHDSIAPGYWFAILDAPPTPPGYREPAAPSRLQWPIRGPISQPFGCTDFSLEPTTAACPGGFHYGIDIAVAQGLPVRAAGAGIAYPLPDYEIYGNHVLVSGAGGVGTVYGHLSAMTVTWGQPVKAGDVIGYVGSTGNSTGPHLHFEVRFAGLPVDPQPWLDGRPPDPTTLPFGWPGYQARDDLLGLH